MWDYSGKAVSLMGSVSLMAVRRRECGEFVTRRRRQAVHGEDVGRLETRAYNLTTTAGALPDGQGGRPDRGDGDQRRGQAAGAVLSLLEASWSQRREMRKTGLDSSSSAAGPPLLRLPGG
jgi:hypothetical protein